MIGFHIFVRLSSSVFTVSVSQWCRMCDDSIIYVLVDEQRLSIVAFFYSSLCPALFVLLLPLFVSVFVSVVAVYVSVVAVSVSVVAVFVSSCLMCLLRVVRPMYVFTFIVYILTFFYVDVYVYNGETCKLAMSVCLYVWRLCSL